MFWGNGIELQGEGTFMYIGVLKETFSLILGPSSLPEALWRYKSIQARIINWLATMFLSQFLKLLLVTLIPSWYHHPPPTLVRDSNSLPRSS